MKNIIIKGLAENNLKNLSFEIPKHKIVVFTGVSGSGKSSIVFDTIGAESQRQMNETYPAFIRGKLPQYKKPNVETIKNLTPTVIVDQRALGGNIRSTVGTISDLYTDLRLLFSRIGLPYIGTASYFSFNDPNGMCLNCSGIGKVTTLDITKLIDFKKSLNEGCIMDTTHAPNTWYWKQYAESQLFDLDKPISQYDQEELNLFLYGSKTGIGEVENQKVIGIYNKFKQTYLNRDMSSMSKTMKEKSKRFTKEEPCTCCNGKRLNQKVLECKISGYSIFDMCNMELTELLEVLKNIDNQSVKSLLESLKSGITRMIEIGLPYLHLNRESTSLSGGEAQRLKLVRYMGSSLSDITYIFDEPSRGMHPYDVEKISRLLMSLRDMDNTVIVVEHDKDVIAIADEIIDIGMDAGKNGGEIVFQGTYKEILEVNTMTSKALKFNLPIKIDTRKPSSYLAIRNAKLNNLKNISIDIPVGIMSVVTGVAGSGKSTLISKVFNELYKDDIIMVDQKPIFATNRSTPASYLDIFDEIRSVFAKENKVDKSYLSFNSKGACEKCNGKGVIVTELVHMDPVVNTCEACNGGRYNQYSLSLLYNGKSILDILSMSVEEAYSIFDNHKIIKKLKALKEVGLSYLTLGQPLSTLSGGEIQRIKLAKSLNQKGKIYVLDEPTTGLHSSDIEKLIDLFNKLVDKKNTVIVIEHHTDVIKQADYIIDVGPKGGKSGGEIVFKGTPLEMIENSNSLTAISLRNSIQSKDDV